MRILLTNNTLGARAGSELYLRDVAIELMRRGHHPVAYSTVLGPVAEELMHATVPVIRSLDSLGEAPDIIHGQHHYEALSAMLRFPSTPAIHYCHGWTPWQESPLRFPRILRYVAVDELCRERLITEGGVPPDRIELLFNFFDARNFLPRSPLPVRPKLALAFSNTFNEQQDLPLLREACVRCGIELHAVGLAIGESESNPGELLQKYDLVFAKARAAIEAMAVGAAVVLCNPGRLGVMVTSESFPRLQPLNFGVRTLDRPLELEPLIAEIDRYSATDAAHVSATVREENELQGAVDRLIHLYERVIKEARQVNINPSACADHAAARYLEQHSVRFKRDQMEDDRGRWVERAQNSEADRDRWSERCLSSEADRDRWSERCLDSEADRDRWSERCLKSEADRDRLFERCLSSEADRDRWVERAQNSEVDRDRWSERYLSTEADRDRWSERCLKSEADRDRWSARCQGSEADRDRWSERCLNAEADRERWVERCLNAEADRNRWVKRCLDAEAERESLRPNAELAEHHEQQIHQLEQGWRRQLESLSTELNLRHEQAEHKWAADNARLVHDLQSTASELHAAEFTLADIQGSFAWRMTKGVLESYPMRSMVRPAIRVMRKQWRDVLAR